MIMLIMPSAWLPRDARQMPKKSEKVMMPRMFILTAATTTLSGTMLRATASSAWRGDALVGDTLAAAACAAGAVL